MSSNSRPDTRAGVRRRLALVAAVLAAGLALAAPAPARHAPPAGRTPGAPPAAAEDESTAVALELINDLRAVYGGDDNWAAMDGLRYALTYTIPGPDGAPVRTWTETHCVWLHGVPRVRIDTDEDSSIVIVAGDTTHVRRGGAWVTDPVAVAAARAQALDTWWAWQLPRALVNRGLRPRQLGPPLRGEPFTTRFHFAEPGLGWPAGTQLDVTFAPPSYAMRTLHWYDPRAKSWFRLDLADDRQRYQWTWAGHRTLHASNEAGEPGPVVWMATVLDMQVEGQMPAIVLHPPDAGPGVVVPVARAHADSTAR